MKLTALILGIIGLVGTIAGFVLVSVAGVSCSSTDTCGSSTDSATGLAVIGVLVLLVGLITGLIGWVFGLISSIKMRQWGWFVAVFLLGALGAILYGALAPRANESAPAPVGSYPQM